MTTSRQTLDFELTQLLQPHTFKDFCPNGLQVEGKTEIKKIISGVTASQALIDHAIAVHADAVLVHHGLFWRGHDGRVNGWLRKRLAALLANNINLWAYHLPLDAHATLGNNAQLGQVLGLGDALHYRRFGEQNLGMWVDFSLNLNPISSVFAPLNSAQNLALHIEKTLGRKVICVAPNNQALHHVAWCTGGAQSYFQDAISLGADVFITGEISEPQAHYAREMGVAYIACGHHASERYGAKALGTHIAQLLGLEHEFIDIDNPA